MKSVTVWPSPTGLKGELSFPGDKSLSHRAIIFGALAKGKSSFANVLEGQDCVCTRKAFENLGVKIKRLSPTRLEIEGRGIEALKPPRRKIYLGNSGTSMRLLLGVLASRPFKAVLTGDPSLSSRPMRRVTDYLKKMGAAISGRDEANFAPITIEGGALRAITAKLPIASAQVKSAILLAGLSARGTTRVVEPAPSRDHTERFLSYFGAKIKKSGLSVSLQADQELRARSFTIAGDISSAAFFMAMAILAPHSRIGFRSVLWNPTRTGLVSVLKRMGAQIRPKRVRLEGPERVADFSLSTTPLRAVEIRRRELPSLIDEIPILVVMATQAKGRTVIHDAQELRVKETDRIHSMVTGLSEMGADIRAKGDTLVIEGPTPLRGARVKSFKDHRTAMSLVVAGLVARGPTLVEDVECINTSFPTFFGLLRRAGGKFRVGAGLTPPPPD